MLSTIVNFLNKIKKFTNQYSRIKKPLCSIEEIDMTNKSAVIACRGITKIHVKLGFSEIIFDKDILSNLSSVHAAWIGYYSF